MKVEGRKRLAALEIDRERAVPLAERGWIDDDRIDGVERDGEGVRVSPLGYGFDQDVLCTIEQLKAGQLLLLDEMRKKGKSSKGKGGRLRARDNAPDSSSKLNPSTPAPSFVSARTKDS